MQDNHKIRLAITAMMNGFHQGAKDPDLFIATVEAAVGSASAEAIIDAAQRFASGRVKGQQTKFAPSSAEFCAEVRAREEHLRLMEDRERRMALPPIKRQFGQGQSPFEKRNRDIEYEMRGHPVLAHNIAHSAFKDYPDGSVWRANGTVYGPEGSNAH